MADDGADLQVVYRQRPHVEAGAGALHRLAFVRPAFLVLLLCLRLHKVVAELHAHFAKGAEGAVMGEKQNAEPRCQANDCDKAAGAAHDGLCPSHWFAFKATVLEGLACFEQHLRLEAEFTEWCREHGQPNPHDE